VDQRTDGQAVPLAVHCRSLLCEMMGGDNVSAHNATTTGALGSIYTDAACTDALRGFPQPLSDFTTSGAVSRFARCLDIQPPSWGDNVSAL
jgi:hypothetical protein